MSAIIARAATSAQATTLERMTEAEDEGGTLAAEGEIEPQRGAAEHAEPDTGPIGGLEPRPAHRVDARRDLSGIDEDRAADQLVDQIPILALQREQVPIAEAKRRIPAADVQAAVGRRQ